MRLNIFPAPMIANVIIVKSSANAAASPQNPCSARFRIFIEVSGVLNDTRKITALIVPTPRTKSYKNALAIAVLQSGKITSKSTRKRFAPAVRAASSRVDFTWAAALDKMRYENGRKPTAIAITMRTLELWKLSRALESENAKPKSEPGTAAGSCAIMSITCLRGHFVR